MDVDFVRNDLDTHGGATSADAALLRRLTATSAPGRPVRLHLRGGEARRLRALLVRAGRMGDECRAGDEALERLERQSQLIDACLRRARSEGGPRLPGWGARPRIGVALRAVLADGSEPMTRERLAGALRELDALQPLTMSELWAVPQALRVAICRSLLRLAGRVVSRARACGAAADWVRRPSGDPSRRGDAFIEEAVRRAGEDGLRDARRTLERAFERRGLSVEEAVARSQAARAADLVRLDNLLDAIRVIDALNWREEFEALSAVEAELRRDPSGVYPKMDAESRDAVRAQVAHIAARLGAPERAIARNVADAARAGEGLAGGVCWWLYDDAGRRALKARLNRPGARLRRMTPDPSGRRTVGAIVLLAGLIAGALAACAGTPALWPACLILGWAAADAVVGRMYPLRFRPARLLKLEMARVDDGYRTLVTMPALLSGPARAESVCNQLEALGCLEGDRNIEFLLLGDFADAPSARMPGDEALLEAVRARVARMNARAGRNKYAFLCRPRTLLAADNLWMGRDRKRGALEDLNRLLLDEAGAEEAFIAEGEACARLAGRFAYVLTLDADTKMLPGEARRLIGAMAHPLNRPDGKRGYAVLQPRMETLPSACVNRYMRLFAGEGGVNAYPVTVSNLWQDLTGRGIYGGKGIYDVAAFRRRLDGALPEGRVLSHDLIEGAIAGAGFAGDIVLYDAGPTTLGAGLRRLHRWTRGDWQLAPLMLSRRLPNGRRLGAADRFRMLDNLVRSLRAPSLLALTLRAVWAGSGEAMLAALALSYLEALLRPFDGDALKWRRATTELAALPALAWCSLDAIGRALWRTLVSGRRMMDWVTAADAESGARVPPSVRVPQSAAALMALPGLLTPGWAQAALALAALYLIAPHWIGDMERTPVDARAALCGDERATLLRLARDTWQFFADNVDATCPLPPDNVQLDPPVGAARRTSPTNIAMYLMAALSARRLGLIDTDALRARLDATVTAVEGLEKWRGNPFNWYDIDTGAPLRPRYVSSVDCGNLAAALLLCANAGETGAALSARMHALARGMTLSALYDTRRELFRVGLDVDAPGQGAPHYDLLASEARILSFTAMMLGQAPVRHWRRLGRACVRVGSGVAPLSWGGTMFEYLMPELFLSAPAHTLLGDGTRAAVRAQMRLGRRQGRPWGVSESGYCALDAALNYQYRAFGLRALALNGETGQDVVAPYAAALAACVEPAAAARNLARMESLGWSGRWGLFEAADYARGDEKEPALVKSHMAHHQGMALCALCNALTGDSLRRDFMAIPEARALSPLLEERPCAKPGRRAERFARRPGAPRRGEYARRADPNAPFPRVHLLGGGGAGAICTDDGATHYRRHGVDATRFEGRLQDRADMARTWLTDVGTGVRTALGENGGARFEPGAARYEARLKRLEASMTVCVSPEDGTLLRVVNVVNRSDRPVECAVTDILPVALAPEAGWRDHAAFQRLFVDSAAPQPGLLLFTRRPSGRKGERARLAHLAVGGAVSFDTDYDRLAGRTGDAGRNTAFDRPLPGIAGRSLNCAAAQRVAVTLAPGQRARVRFAAALLDGDERAEEWAARWREAGWAERALRLAAARARTTLDFIGLDARAHGALQRLAALLVDGALAAEARGTRRGEAGAARDELWRHGISGDRPILVMSVRDAADARTVHALIRAHEFYRTCELATDLVLVDDGGFGYARPVREMIEGLIASSPLNRLRGTAGGVWVIDGAELDNDGRRALLRHASAAFSSKGDFYAQALALTAFDSPRRGRLAPMNVGASTLRGEALICDNGFGGFLPDGGYRVKPAADQLPPAPWCNVLAGEGGGMLLSERGGGFAWHGNSREGRLTPFGNDNRFEGWGLMLYLVDEARGEYLRLLPGDRPMIPFHADHGASGTRYAFETRRASGAVAFSTIDSGNALAVDVTLSNRALRGEAFSVWAYVEWLMGAARGDAVALNCWREGGACMATGAMTGVGWLASTEPTATGGTGRAAFLGRGGVMAPEGFGASAGEGWTLRAPIALKPGGRRALRFALGWSEDVQTARERIRALDGATAEGGRMQRPALVFETPDRALNALANGFLIHQVRAARVLGRTGLSQPGGAWGFRDQLQDMLSLIEYEPARVRAHLLRCAARQFEAGDVLHWWHAPFRGVRTRVSDDMLFLPWVTAAYVLRTGDADVLGARVAYLEDAPIPDGEADLYREMTPGSTVESLHAHCMRAFRRAARRGAHGLLLMGTGDWNDGMNRVGARGRGESVWLTQFAIACVSEYRKIAPVEADRVWLWRLSEELRAAVERAGWDGGWYLRAYDDDGAKLGGAGCGACGIDLLPQAWAVLAELDAARCRAAIDAAWERLVDEKAGVIRLLEPPFGGEDRDPGYIRDYPPGVRENGGQYTHAALWLLLALIRMGDGERAHRALRMLLPFNHADTRERARIYRVEPYVMAGDICACPGHTGEGGWTWYTGAAGWAHECLLALLGYERRGDRIRLSALLGDWARAGLSVTFGDSVYRLVCDRDAVRATLDGEAVDGDFIRMVDDGRAHEARFPARQATDMSYFPDEAHKYSRKA